LFLINSFFPRVPLSPFLLFASQGFLPAGSVPCFPFTFFLAVLGREALRLLKHQSLASSYTFTDVP